MCSQRMFQWFLGLKLNMYIICNFPNNCDYNIIIMMERCCTLLLWRLNRESDTPCISVYFICLRSGGSDLRKPGKQWGTAKTNHPTQLDPKFPVFLNFLVALHPPLEQQGERMPHPGSIRTSHSVLNAKRTGSSKIKFTCTVIARLQLIRNLIP